MEEDWIKHVENVKLMPRINPQVFFLIEKASTSEGIIKYCKDHDIKLYNYGRVKDPKSHFVKDFEDLQTIAAKLPNIPVDGFDTINKETIRNWFFELFTTHYPDLKADYESLLTYVVIMSFPECTINDKKNVIQR